MKKLKKSDAVSEVEHRHGNSVASLQYARISKSIKTQQVDGYKHER